MAATSPDVHGGEYLGPGGLGELYGAPKEVQATKKARDGEAAAQLWALSEELTGLRYAFEVPGTEPVGPGERR